MKQAHLMRRRIGIPDQEIRHAKRKINGNGNEKAKRERAYYKGLDAYAEGLRRLQEESHKPKTNGQ